MQNLLLKQDGPAKIVRSLAKVVLDNAITLGYLLAEQGGVCAMANTTCCTFDAGGKGDAGDKLTKVKPFRLTVNLKDSTSLKKSQDLTHVRPQDPTPSQQ